MQTRFAACAALLTGALAVFTAAHAADTINMIVPFSAGGPTDLIARTIAPSLSDKLGKTVVVENHGGAGGTIGANLAAHAKPDGHTILLTTSSLILSTGTRSKLPFDARKDLMPVYLLGEVQTMLAVNPKLGVDTLQELIDKARGTPEGLNYGSTGVGGTMHVGAELLRKAADIPLVHVPYRGAAPALVALMAGQVDLVNADVPVLQPYIKDGRLKGLVIYDTRRSPLLPDIPTASEAGMPALQMTNWYGVLVPAGTPDSFRKTLEGALNEVVHEPEIAAKLAQAGFSNPKDTAGFQARLDQDFGKWLPWLKANNIHTD
ncbi:tripartite tricarboxylate transporter substrate binding protein [Allopusillimonas soli]|uniref:Tripartite tricarboxylate transporter substrate binding protein n=1 Tax=Allopusillimonas soli TaxID=659016 RepID=A0A853FDV9_9BURK|nr:tripartite tricarboxylate transporter substrate binding protein [Allopusillimonas soli]NYT39055.1 tripartite tricarboxylate transporter substrate binding protein [Allopusillimonas soli]TEA69513.1 tripartite tricarboxylate transporter substrate binding protein [Allopusillimonas soli]